MDSDPDFEPELIALKGELSQVSKNASAISQAMAEIHYNAGRYNKALEIYDVSVGFNPHNREALSGYKNCMAAKNSRARHPRFFDPEPPELFILQDELNQMKQKAASILLTMARIHEKADCRDQAIRTYNAVFNYDARNAEAISGLGDCVAYQRARCKVPWEL